MTIAVTGATGQLGRLVIAKLKEKTPAADIVALARHPAKAADLGVAVREADYSKPETLDEGARRRRHAAADLVERDRPARRPAPRTSSRRPRRPGCKRIVYTSLLRADASPLSLAEEHRATEADLRPRAFRSPSCATAGTPRTTPARSAARWPAAHSSAALGEGQDLLRRARRLRRRGRRRADRRGPRGQDLRACRRRGLHAQGPRGRNLAPDRQDNSVQEPAPDGLRRRSRWLRPAANSSPRRSPAGTSAPRKAPCSTTGMRSPKLIGRPTTPLSATVADALK